MILQAAGLGYLIAGSILVSDAAAYKSASGKFNFWCHCNKSVAVFDSIKTHSVEGTIIFISKQDNRRHLHVPSVLLQQNDLPVPLGRRLMGPYSRSGRFGVDETSLPILGIESLSLSFPACCLLIVIIT